MKAGFGSPSVTGSGLRELESGFTRREGWVRCAERNWEVVREPMRELESGFTRREGWVRFAERDRERVARTGVGVHAA